MSGSNMLQGNCWLLCLLFRKPMNGWQLPWLVLHSLVFSERICLCLTVVVVVVVVEIGVIVQTCAAVDNDENVVVEINEIEDILLCLTCGVVLVMNEHLVAEWEIVMMIPFYNYQNQIMILQNLPLKIVRE